jgi:cyanophycinase
LLQPAVFGFGIDENTAILVSADEFEVIGQGAVTVIDESEKLHDNMEGLLKDEALAICGVKLHILPHGYRFNLKTRQPVLDRAATAGQREMAIG